MNSTEGLYRLVGQIGNSSVNVVILLVISLVFIVVYFKAKKLLISLITFFLLATIFFYNSEAKVIYSYDNTYVLNDGSYIKVYEIKDNKIEYTRFSKYQDVLEIGLYRDKKFVPYPYYSKSNYNFFLDSFILTVLLIIVYIVLFFKDDIIKIRDYKRNIELTPYSYKTTEEKRKTLKENLYCSSCNSKEEIQIDKEVYKNGMHLLYLKCEQCLNEKKYRIDL